MPGFCENVNLSDFARQSIPAQRAATFEEIGQACVFLASYEARYINGQSILSDGGMKPGGTIRYLKIKTSGPQQTTLPDTIKYKLHRRAAESNTPHNPTDHMHAGNAQKLLDFTCQQVSVTRGEQQNRQYRRNHRLPAGPGRPVRSPSTKLLRPLRRGRRSVAWRSGNTEMSCFEMASCSSSSVVEGAARSTCEYHIDTD